MKRVLYVFTACIALAACGGGGGSSSGGGGGVTPPGPVPTSTPPAPTQQSERADAQQSLSAYQAASQITPTGGNSILSTGRRAPEFASEIRLRRHMHTLTTSACSNGVITSTNQTSSTTATITVYTYYDATCVTLWQDLTWSVTASGTTLAGPFSTDQYAQTGTQTGYVSGLLSVTLNSALSAITALSIQMNDISTTASAPSLGQLGLACALSTSLNCGVAVVGNVGSTAEQGVDMTLGATETPGSAGSYTVALTLSAQGYTSGAGAMAIAPATFPAWTISGGTLSAALSGTMSVGYAANGSSTSLSATFTDPQYGTAVSLSATSTGISGSISRTGTSYGSFTTDASGNGTITYSNGATGQIADWIIVG